jgi:hypothetical protein
VSRARARAGLREMRRGSECGHERNLKRGWGVGRATWPRIPATCASACSLVHGRRGEGGTDRGGPRRREREKGRVGQRLVDWRTGPARQRESEREGEETGTDNLAPLGSEREREGARERKLPLIGGSHLSGGAGARACGRAAWLGRAGPAGLLCLFLFLWIFLLLFHFFSLGVSIQIQFKLQIQTNSNMCNNSNNI